MPEAVTAPPPPKPAPPPTKPSSPPPRQERPIPPKPEPKDTGALDDAFADLDKIEAKDVASKEPRKQDKKQTLKDERKSSEEDNAGDVDEAQEDEAKPEKETKADEKTKDGEEAKPVRAAELRTAYEKSKATIKEKDSEISRLKTELESKLKTEDPEKKTLVERLTTTEKKLKEYEDELRFTNYKNHPEFKEKFEDPYHGAFKKALADFEQIHVTDDEGNKRLATRNDLDAMLRMSIAQVDELATEKFGHSAARVIRHVEKLRDLADAYHGALEDAKTKGGEREKTKALEFQKQDEQRHKLWQDENEAFTKKYPKWLSLKEGDDEYNKALETGTALADAVFLRRDKVEPDRLVKLDAEAYSKIRGHERLVMVAKRRAAKIAALEKALKEYEASDPSSEGDEPPNTESDGSWEKSAFDELDAIERKARK